MELTAKEQKRLKQLDHKIMSGRKATRAEIMEAFDLQRKKRAAEKRQASESNA